MDDDPYHNFVMQCDKGMVNVLSLLQKINEGSFNLVGYRLNDTYCKAIKEALSSNLFEEQIETVLLDNNAMTSLGFNTILEGLTSLTRIRKLVYKNNRLDSELPMAPNGPLRELLLRQEPYNLHFVYGIHMLFFSS